MDEYGTGWCACARELRSSCVRWCHRLRWTNESAGVQPPEEELEDSAHLSLHGAEQQGPWLSSHFVVMPTLPVFAFLVAWVHTHQDFMLKMVPNCVCHSSRVECVTRPKTEMLPLKIGWKFFFSSEGIQPASVYSTTFTFFNLVWRWLVLLLELTSRMKEVDEQFRILPWIIRRLGKEDEPQSIVGVLLT